MVDYPMRRLARAEFRCDHLCLRAALLLPALDTLDRVTTISPFVVLGNLSILDLLARYNTSICASNSPYAMG